MNKLCSADNLGEYVRAFTETTLEIVSEEILDDVEKKYLGNLVKPFKKEWTKITIAKLEGCMCKQDEITIRFYENKGLRGFICLPCFERGSMYRCMEHGREYTLEELGL